MTATFRPCSRPDWFVVDGAEFGKPEGSKAEWETILDAMETGEGISFERVAVRLENGDALLFSPRNQADDEDFALVLAEEIPAWIERARKVLKGEA